SWFLWAFFQTGMASWYGKQFHGKRTATGEAFDMNEATAAHPTLPLGSFALVRNMANDKTVVVKINDRGPYARNRIIDLSYAAAKQLGFVRAGHAKVEIRRLSRSEVAALGLDDANDAR
ncbi:septal ring lytic transglycosylase RlpA family protein, partial [Pandoraea pnomenusa]|uniref:septal ring lytic transglycosylase RlpA family protein n=1 Tax=Pandoraea pnomenusa TaxID=93220 RepID=UPI00242CD5A2